MTDAQKDQYKRQFVDDFEENIALIGEMFAPQSFAETFGVFDLIFILLGLGTAYRVASNGRY